MSSRRAVLTGSLASVALSPVAGRAQPATGGPTIAFLVPASGPYIGTPTAVFDSFRRGLADLGHGEGRNIRYEYRSAPDRAGLGEIRRGGPPKPWVEFAPDSPLEGDGFEPLVPLPGRAQLSRHARGGSLPSACSFRIQPSSSIRSAAMKARGWSSMTWCLASGTSTTGARGPIRDDM
jgi:hypothetical protein